MPAAPKEHAFLLRRWTASLVRTEVSKRGLSHVGASLTKIIGLTEKRCQVMSINQVMSDLVFELIQRFERISVGC